MIRRVAYAALFVIALPAALAAWAHRLDSLIVLPLPSDALASPAGIALLAAGLALMVAGTRDLWRFGHGLPASPFPPQQLVTRGAYRLVADPIYVGAVCVSAGLSLWARSAAGLWIVSPTLALATTAFVIGYERDATFRRFGATPAPLLRFPPETDERPTAADRVSVYALVFAPWLVLYRAVALLGAAHVAPASAVPWNGIVYAATYVFVLGAPLFAGRRRELRELASAGLTATVLIIPFYLLVPIGATSTSVSSFHVVWACLAARLFASRTPTLRWVWWAVAVAIGAALVAANIDTAIAVIGGVVAYTLVARRRAIWELVRGTTEQVANSWRETSIGPVRLINHGIYAGLGAALSIGLSIALTGPGQLGWLAASVFGAVVGAGLWGQFLEGSSALLRPYGYFGAVVGGITVALIAAASGADAWLIFCAFGVGSTITSAFGRLRCLVQGCCHGRPAPASVGIRFTHPRSRVVRLSPLGGVPVHPTQLYALASALLVGCVLVRLWVLGAPLSLIAGVYFLLFGISRFVEEHFRGEPQTETIGGLRVYQWLAIAFVIGGAALTTIRTDAAPSPHPIELGVLPVLALIGVLTYAAYGLDFPASGWRFSRLT